VDTLLSPKTEKAQHCFIVLKLKLKWVDRQPFLKKSRTRGTFKLIIPGKTIQTEHWYGFSLQHSKRLLLKQPIAHAQLFLFLL
jgi:hypothetical protein